jgi:UDP-2-acetamido-3-amino-2,3-dideoxy-glucuronate N-acetyltransferase
MAANGSVGTPGGDHPGVFIHETAVVDPGAEIGTGSKVWHFVHVCAGAKIGSDVSLGQNVFVAPGAIVGDGCRVQNNVSVYEGVVLEEDVFCGPSMVFTNVRTPRAFVSRKEEYSPTLVGRGATLGANCTIVCGNAIGVFAMVAAGATVTHDVRPYELVAGTPARHMGWVCRCGEVLHFEGDDDGAVCDRCGLGYELDRQKGSLREHPV